MDWETCSAAAQPLLLAAEPLDRRLQAGCCSSQRRPRERESGALRGRLGARGWNISQPFPCDNRRALTFAHCSDPGKWEDALELDTHFRQFEGAERILHSRQHAPTAPRVHASAHSRPRPRPRWLAAACSACWPCRQAHQRQGRGQGHRRLHPAVEAHGPEDARQGAREAAQGGGKNRFPVCVIHLRCRLAPGRPSTAAPSEAHTLTRRPGGQASHSEGSVPRGALTARRESPSSVAALTWQAWRPGPPAALLPVPELLLMLLPVLLPSLPLVLLSALPSARLPAEGRSQIKFTSPTLF